MRSQLATYLALTSGSSRRFGEQTVVQSSISHILLFCSFPTFMLREKKENIVIPAQSIRTHVAQFVLIMTKVYSMELKSMVIGIHQQEK